MSRSALSGLALGLLLLAAAACSGSDPRPTEVAAVPSTSAPAAPPAVAVGAALGSLAPLPAEAFPDGPCGGFERSAKPAVAQSLLGGRLTMKALDGLEPLGRPHSIMAAAWAAEMETRLFLERDDKKLVVFVEELFRRPVADLAAAIQAQDSNAADAFVGTLSIAGLSAIGVVPKHPRADEEKFLALGLYLVMPDGLMVRARFYLSPEVLPQGAGCSKLARGMAETLAAGARKLDLGGGPRDLDSGLSIQVPPNTLLVPQEGPDFIVYHAIPVAPYGASAGELNVYIGGHPRQLREGTRVPGKLLGAAVDWSGQQADDGFLLREALTEIPGSRGLFAHVFYAAPDAAGLAVFEKMAQSLQKTR